MTFIILAKLMKPNLVILNKDNPFLLVAMVV